MKSPIFSSLLSVPPSCPDLPDSGAILQCICISQKKCISSLFVWETPSLHTHAQSVACRNRNRVYTHAYTHFQLSHNLRSFSCRANVVLLSLSFTPPLVFLFLSFHFPLSVFIITEQRDDTLLWFCLWDLIQKKLSRMEHTQTCTKPRTHTLLKFIFAHSVNL